MRTVRLYSAIQQMRIQSIGRILLSISMSGKLDLMYELLRIGQNFTRDKLINHMLEP